MVAIIVTIRQFLRDRIQIQVNCERGTTIGVFFDSLDNIEILAVNTGFRAVEIRGAGFMMSNKKKYTGCLVDLFPKKLSEGESVTIVFDLDDVKLAVERLGGNVKYKYSFVQTSNGKIFKGKLPKLFMELKIA